MTLHYPGCHLDGCADERDGVYLAHYADNDTAFVPFGTEVEALRFAIDRGMKVTFVQYGTYVGPESAGWAQAKRGES